MRTSAHLQIKYRQSYALCFYAFIRRARNHRSSNYYRPIRWKVKVHHYIALSLFGGSAEVFQPCNLEPHCNDWIWRSGKQKERHDGLSVAGPRNPMSRRELLVDALSLYSGPVVSTSRPTEPHVEVGNLLINRLTHSACAVYFPFDMLLPRFHIVSFCFFAKRQEIRPPA